ncbi:MAG TPA: hypothetical protein VML55_04610 [Planctomycetaceae bacterium]|nr:hypothetical protein [Planctomycetaceae bacterium]
MTGNDLILLAGKLAANPGLGDAEARSVAFDIVEDADRIRLLIERCRQEPAFLEIRAALGLT